MRPGITTKFTKGSEFLILNFVLFVSFVVKVNLASTEPALLPADLGEFL